MKIKRTYKKTSLRFGQTEFIDEAKMREIAGQTTMARHGAEGECGRKGCIYCPEVAMGRLLAGATVEQSFSTFELVEA